MTEDEIIAKAKAEELNRICDIIDMSIGLYGGFYPDIADALMGLLKSVDEARYQQSLAIIEAYRAKHGA